MEVFQSKSTSNLINWKNAAYDEWIEKARAATEPSQRLTAFHEAEKILLREEIVIYPLFYKQNVAITGPRVDYFELTPLNYLFFKSVLLR